MTVRRVATYRIQLRPGLGFGEAAGAVPYLERLGVSHLYTSPSLAAAPGSTHGYDVVDHGSLNRDLGGAEAHRALREALDRAGLAQIIDLVPNHMAIGHRENRWWWDVLENGRSSRYASYFDVDWDPPESKLRDTVLLPVLDDHYGRVLEAGRLRLERSGGQFVIRYGEQTYPCSPKALDQILAGADLHDLSAEAASLPSSDQDDEASVRERHERKERLAGEIAGRSERDHEVAAALDAQVALVNASPDRLDELIARQNYRLAYWRVADRELAYRRFFDINDLVALRIEREHVFRDTHALVLAWAAEGAIDGIRIDHPDGLRDPEEYFGRLAAAAPGSWLLAEKILQPGEELPTEWAVAGTTGYDFARVAGGLFIDPAGEAPLTGLYREISGERRDYPAILYEAKHDVMAGSLAADLERLTVFFVRVCEGRRRFRDFTRHELREVLRETVACFPIYRSYVRAEHGIVRDADRRVIDQAIDAARTRRPELDAELFGLLADILTLRITGPNETGLTMRFQQYTAPVMAKGAEDTAFYRYARLLALNEVGGDPGRFGTTVDEFHAHNARIQERWPGTMLATTTHDTKRSADVRLRLALLSHDPAGWAAAVARWRSLTAAHRGPLVDGELEYLIYQTWLGAHPLPVDRAVAFVDKAAREAKRQTSWTRPEPEYEAALRHFVEASSADPAFARDLATYSATWEPAARAASLALTLLQLTSPGVPDIYQGSETLYLSLVDPDSRRPVDFAERERLLDAVLGGDRAAAPKMALIQRTLALRSRHLTAFAGPYEPISASGARSGDLVAYGRGGEVVTLAARAVHRRGPWGDTRLVLPPGRWRDVLAEQEHDGGEIRLGDLLGGSSVALLERQR